MSQASAVEIEKMPKSVMDTMSVCLRPSESETRPPKSAPKNRPRVLALKNVPI
jgi:hypothetical protein